MKRIKEIKIKNFKAFQQEEVFSFGNKGKNVLVFGNNGSGKSSLFWALYTLLQSSIKDDAKVQKYFKNYLASNKETHQTLKNVFMDEAEDAYIKLTSIDTETKRENVYTISHDTINTNNDDDTIIKELNIASDFINYKLLHNFYRASHKQEVNLWPVFERDIFPFLTEGTKNWLEDIIKKPTLDVPKTRRGNIKYYKKDDYNIELSALNVKIQTLLTEIQDNANSFIKGQFFENKDTLRVTLTFDKKFKFDNVRHNLWGENRDGHRHDTLKIKITVEIYEETPEPHWKKVERVQSFLNEAQLTRIAIGIRIGALRTRPLAAAKFKVLVLDDMLISLDMSNRMDIVRILLNTENDPELERIFGGFQKIILTHDLGFYELVKRYTAPEDWEYFKFYSSELVNEPPKIRNDRSRIEKAQSFLVDGEYDACGSELRRETEALLDKYLKGLKLASTGEFEPLMNKLNNALKQITENNRRSFNRATSTRGLPNEIIEKLKTNFEVDGTLTPEQIGKLRSLRNGFVDYITNQIRLNADSERLLIETKDILRRIMNPASHHLLVPLYEDELKKAIDGVIELKTILESEELDA